MAYKKLEYEEKEDESPLFYKIFYAIIPPLFCHYEEGKSQSHNLDNFAIATLHSVPPAMTEFIYRDNFDLLKKIPALKPVFCSD